MTDLSCSPIGVLHTPWQTMAACPRNGRQPDPAPACTALIFPQFLEGLASLDGFSHLILLYWLNHAPPAKLSFTPPFRSSASWRLRYPRPVPAKSDRSVSSRLRWF